MGGMPITLLGNEIKLGMLLQNLRFLTGDLNPYSLKDAGDKVKIISVVPSWIQEYAKCKP